MALPTAKAILLVEPVQRRGVNGKIAKDRCIWPIVTFWPLAHRREASKRCRFSHKIFHAISRQRSSSQCICGARAAPISTRFSTDRVLCPLFSLAITNDCERGTYILLRPTAICSQLMTGWCSVMGLARTIRGRQSTQCCALLPLVAAHGR